MVKKKEMQEHCQEQEQRSLEREAAVWALTAHPNIARLYQVAVLFAILSLFVFSHSDSDMPGH